MWTMLSILLLICQKFNSATKVSKLICQLGYGWTLDGQPLVPVLIVAHLTIDWTGSAGFQMGTFKRSLSDVFIYIVYVLRQSLPDFVDI